MAKKNTKPRFERASRTLDYTDERGTVRVRVTLADPENPAKFKKGNLSKQFSIRNTKVSTVLKEMDKSFFGDK